MFSKSKIVFSIFSQFAKTDRYIINLTCNHGKQILTMSYKPVCHSEYADSYTDLLWHDSQFMVRFNKICLCDPAVKLARPGKPAINLTTISWRPQDTPSQKFDETYTSYLQWKKKDQSWSVCIWFESVLIHKYCTRNECVYVQWLVYMICTM